MVSFFQFWRQGKGDYFQGVMFLAELSTPSVCLGKILIQVISHHRCYTQHYFLQQPFIYPTPLYPLTHLFNIASSTILFSQHHFNLITYTHLQSIVHYIVYLSTSLYLTLLSGTHFNALHCFSNTVFSIMHIHLPKTSLMFHSST